MVFWAGYERSVRVEGCCWRLWVRRARCARCAVSHALVPAFCLLGRLDVVDSVGEAIAAVVAGGVGMRPVAQRFDVPHTTARGWLRRFRSRAAMLTAGFSTLAVEVSGTAPDLPAGADRAALAAMTWAWASAVSRAGSGVGDLWVFVSLVTGGMLLAANTDPPWLMFGRRRLMPPVP
jgi:transposase-like protein